jgi:hypothetical protein
VTALLTGMIYPGENGGKSQARRLTSTGKSFKVKAAGHTISFWNIGKPRFNLARGGLQRLF